MRIAILVPELPVQGGGDRQRCYPDACSRLCIVVTGVRLLARLPIPSRRRSAIAQEAA
jgi:hypothetical protein